MQLPYTLSCKCAGEKYKKCWQRRYKIYIQYMIYARSRSNFYWLSLSVYFASFISLIFISSLFDQVNCALKKAHLSNYFICPANPPFPVPDIEMLIMWPRVNTTKKWMKLICCKRWYNDDQLLAKIKPVEAFNDRLV